MLLGVLIAQSNKNMKKTFLFLAILIASLSITEAFANSVTTVQFEQKNDSGWEKLGEVKIAGPHVFGDAILYVKVIGERYFYKLVLTDIKGGYMCEYTVSLGRYTYNGKSYNAKAGDYYFNL